jgi:hypothetical protein
MTLVDTNVILDVATDDPKDCRGVGLVPELLC